MFFFFRSDFAQTEREFSIQHYSSPPRYRKQLEFLQKGFGPGDNVSTKVEILAAEGGAPKGATISAVAQLNGSDFFSEKLELDSEGNGILNFQMPQELPDDSSAILIISIDDGSITESISKTIPILKDNFQVHFYPEGGRIVENLINFVYFECLLNSNEPADIDAVIFEKSPQGREIPIERFQTIHEGRGKFSFTPKSDHFYRCEIIRPDVGNYEPKLPEILENGIVLHSLKEIYESDENLTISVGATNACKLLAQIFRKEVLVYQEEVNFSEDTIEVSKNYLSNLSTPSVSIYGNALPRDVKNSSNVSNVDLSLYGGGSLSHDFFEDSFNSASQGN